MKEQDEYGYLYAIGNEGEIKIGISAYHPDKRLNQMQSGNARLLELIGTTYVQGYKVIERILHRELKTKGQWIRGEWYRLSVDEAREIISGVGEDLIMKNRIEQLEQLARMKKRSLCSCGNELCVVCAVVA